MTREVEEKYFRRKGARKWKEGSKKGEERMKGFGRHTKKGKVRLKEKTRKENVVGGNECL